MTAFGVKIPGSKSEALVKKGFVFEAAKLLGRAYSILGRVVEGRKIGRTLGYPTANILPLRPNDIIPAQGVYVAYVKLSDGWHKSMVNIGIRPTLNLDFETIEAHLFDFDRIIYNQFISIHFIQRLRNELRFSSLAELKNQLDSDSQNAARVFQELSLNPLPDHDFIIFDPDGIAN